MLARDGRLRAALIEAGAGGIDPHLIGFLRGRCTVVVVDGRPTRPAWEAIGATVLLETPPDEASLQAALDRADRGSPRPGPTGGAPAAEGAIIAVIAASGGGGATTATALARALAATRSDLAGSGDGGGIVLADLTLDAPHRALHGLDPDRTGLPELVESSRFGAPSAVPVAGALHSLGPGLALLPGLRHHHDWVSVGEAAASSVLRALRAHAEVVVAHVDRDLEGESDTGSYDIEDRNVLARTAVRAADLLVLAGRGDSAGQHGLLAALAALEAFRFAPERTLAVETTTARMAWRNRREANPPGLQVLQRREGDRADLWLGRALRTRLALAGAAPAPVTATPASGEPQRVVPGTLGHWAHDIEGWITPRVPQQP